jgi:hypothetical protein
MPPKFNRRCAVFVLGKIDEILPWEQRKETERDNKFVELGRYLCEVRHLPLHARKQLQEVGWAKGIELAKLARRDRERFDCATWLHKARQMPKEDLKKEVEKELTGQETEPWEII